MLEDFINKYKGKQKGYPTDTNYRGECLSLVKRYIKECYNIDPPPSGSNSAYGYWSNFPFPLTTVFDKITYSMAKIPKAGDIPIWNTKVGNGFGHIDIFVSGDQNSFIGFDQNWDGREAHLQVHDYTNIVGWLTPKIDIMEPVMEIPDYFKTLLQESGLSLDREGEFRAFWDKAKRYDDETNSLKEQLKSVNDALAKRADEVTILIEKNQKLTDTANEANESLNKKRVELDKKTWELTQEKIKTQTLQEEVDILQKQVDKFKETNDLMAYSWFTRFLSLFKRK